MAAWSSRSARSRAFVPTLASSHRPPGTKFTCSALRRMTAPPYVHRMRAAGSVTATTSSPSSAAACSWDWSCRTAADSGLARKATRVSSASASGASCTSGRMCAAERSQLAAISVRTPARSAFADRLSQIAGMCRSQARARCERRLCNCARVAMIHLREPGICRHQSASMPYCGPAPVVEAKGKGPESGSRLRRAARGWLGPEDRTSRGPRAASTEPPVPARAGWGGSRARMVVAPCTLLCSGCHYVQVATSIRAPRRLPGNGRYG